MSESKEYSRAEGDEDKEEEEEEVDDAVSYMMPGMSTLCGLIPIAELPNY